MPGQISVLDSVSGITATTTRAISNNMVAHLSTVYLVRVEDIVGRWNVVLEYIENGKQLEIARVAGIQGTGMHVAVLTPPLDRAPAPVLEPNSIRYFTGTSPSENPRITAVVSMVTVV